MASKSDKLQAVTELLATLDLDLQTPAYPTPAARNAALEQLKIHGRDPSGADPIFTPAGIATITQHACPPSSSSSSSPETTRHALRVLANAMLLVPETRKIFVDLAREKDVIRIMNGQELDSEGKVKGWDDEFLGARVAFLMTYVPEMDVEAMATQHGLAEAVCKNLARHADLVDKGNAPKDMMEEMALGESAKLVFNVTANRPQLVPAFTPTIVPLVTLLWRSEPSPKAPLASPLNLILNALLNLDFSLPDAQTHLFPSDDETKVVARLISILDLSLKAYADADAELEAATAPLASIVRHLHSTAPATPKAYIRKALLPTEEDRNTVLGKGATLAARLLHATTNPMTHALRETISHLMFEMSDSDAQVFVDNIGYGLASGLLFEKGMAPPSSSSRVEEITDDGSAAAPVAAGPARPPPRRPVNPITGQFLDMEKHVDMPEMTDAEKEREAERLFVLFQRMRQNGVIQVADPMRVALEQGRFEDLPDDADVD